MRQGRSSAVVKGHFTDDVLPIWRTAFASISSSLVRYQICSDGVFDFMTPRQS
jgi:hypothetical protein